MKDTFAAYLAKRLQKTLPYFAFFDAPQNPPDIAVVIPALEEYPEILHTLNSLFDSYRANCANSAPGQNAAIIVVINGRTSCTSRCRENNRLTLEAIRARQKIFADEGLTLIAGDCFSAGHEIPENQGVGLARKIGLDFALCLGAKLLACFDADTLCGKNYFEALASNLPLCEDKKGSSRFFAAVTEFYHRKAEIPRVQELIDSYERCLIAHSLKLFDCATPYYPVALGPTLVCSAAAYAACGGMNLRLAGEDFYFLQALIKTSPELNIEKIPACVYPAARFSGRVPFGTGDALLKASQGKRPVAAFADENYVILKKWQYAVKEAAQTSVCFEYAVLQNLLPAARDIDEGLYVFLIAEGFDKVWPRLVKNNKSRPALQKAFHVWFDGLKIIRLFHFLDKRRQAGSLPV